MVSNKSTKKAKKPVDTTLGKAPSKTKEKDTDLSHLRKPIETSICGIKQVLSLLETATNEVKNFVMYECDIMYECRICRSIFRSLANFILHKRNYCREKINPLDYINNNDTYQENVYMSEEKTFSKRDNKSLNKVIEKLQELDRVKEVAKNVLTEDLSSESSNQKIKDMDDREEKSSNINEIVLEKIETNSSGVFQTLMDKSNNDSSASCSNKNKSTKLEVMEIHKILQSDVPVLDPEGKICGFTSNKLHQTSIFPKSEFKCIECNHRFASQKSLTNHIKCVHNPSRIVYICPTCKDTFANPWCVYRHLLKVHRMTNKQVRRLREQVHNSWIQRGDESSIQKKKPPDVNRSEANSENQWINDIEGDNDFQMCAGCGKHFERKAALHSHSQMCAKRLEVCNNIKENAKKKEIVEAYEKTKLEKIVTNKPLLTGASKRKGQSVWSYQRKPKDAAIMKQKTCDSLKTVPSLRIHHTEIDKDVKNNELSGIIPDMLTPKPSPSKNEINDLLSSTINETGQEKQKVFKRTESIKKKENNTYDSEKIQVEFKNNKPIESNEVSKTRDTIPIDSSIVKTEQNEHDEDVENVYSDVENTILAVNTKVEALSSEENSRSTSNLSSESIKTMSLTKSSSSSFEDHSRPRSSSFVKKRNVVSSTKPENSFWDISSRLRSNLFVKSEISISDTKMEKLSNNQETNTTQTKGLTKSKKLFTNIKSEDLSSEEGTQPPLNLFSKCMKFKSTVPNNIEGEEKKFEVRSKGLTRNKKLVTNMKSEEVSLEENYQPELNLFSSNRNTESIISDNTGRQEDNSDSLLQDNHDLLSNEVTFEMFCRKVAEVGTTNDNNKKLETNKRSPRLLRKRRKLTISKEHSTNSNANMPKSSNDDDDDDVIFVGETFGKNNKLNDTSLVLENGFAGFSNEETSKVSYTIDLSNLSYNNPLKCKQKDDSSDTVRNNFEDTGLPHRKPMKRKSRGQSVDNKTAISKHEKSEYNFILRAAPYMNQTKLVCIPCGLSFKSFNLLLWHMSAHFSWFRFQCSKCSFITFNKYDCMLHVRKQHKLKENNAVNFILPLPNWKTVLMSHEFRLLKDCNDLKGKHTDEKIGIDEGQDQYIEDNTEILESDAILFGETLKSSEEDSGVIIEKENVKKRNKSGKMIIDIQETIKDFQKLPEPVELAMPADVSEVIRTLSFDENTLSPDEAVATFDNFGDESNDDWGLPKDSELEPIKSNIVVITKDNEDTEIVKDEKVLNIRPSRIRTKPKQNDDFVYYDNDINNVLKTTEFFKSSPQKHRSDSVLNIKSKVSGKSVPIIQKKKF